MREAAQAAGRNPGEIGVTAVGAPKKELVEGLAAQGVERVLISPSSGDLDTLRENWETFRREIAEPFAD